MKADLVTPDVIRPLRRAVLRPHLPVDESSYASDRLPDAIHVAAFDDGGEVVGCATFFPEEYDGTPAWRLRGMATAEKARGGGYGSAVLARGIAEVAVRGGRLLWCNARTPATGFYARHGFERVGKEFEVPHIGPHYRMTRPLP